MPKSLYIDPVKVREPGYIHFEDIPVCQYNKTIKQELEEGNYTKEDLIRIYRDMAICREFEHMLTLIKTQANYNGVETTYPGPAHLSYGQEASCVGEAYLLNKDDITFGSHRSHSEILSKGLSCINKLSDEELMQTMESFLGGKTLAAVKKFADTSDVKELAIRFLLYGTVAEIFARENGFHHGMGGSMHAFFLPFGVYPNNALANDIVYCHICHESGVMKDGERVMAIAPNYWPRYHRFSKHFAVLLSGGEGMDSYSVSYTDFFGTGDVRHPQNVAYLPSHPQRKKAPFFAMGKSFTLAPGAIREFDTFVGMVTEKEDCHEAFRPHHPLLRTRGGASLARRRDILL